MKNLKFFGILSALLIVAACGGDDDHSAALNTITPDESKAICEAIDGKVTVEDGAKLFCYVLAIIASEEDEELDCEAVAQECIDGIELDEEEAECEGLSQEEIDGLPACAADVTISEYEDCILAQADAIADLVANLSCSIETGLEPEPPAACQPILEKCPAILELQ